MHICISMNISAYSSIQVHTQYPQAILPYIFSHKYSFHYSSQHFSYDMPILQILVRIVLPDPSPVTLLRISWNDAVTWGNPEEVRSMKTPRIHLEVKEKWRIAIWMGFFSRKKPRKLVITLVDLGGNGSKMKELNWPCFFWGVKDSTGKTTVFFLRPNKNNGHDKLARWTCDCQAQQRGRPWGIMKKYHAEWVEFCQKDLRFFRKKIVNLVMIPFFQKANLVVCVGKNGPEPGQVEVYRLRVEPNSKVASPNKKSMVQ